MRTITAIGLAVLLGSCAQASDNYDDLLTLFADWREFERPPMLDGAPDYTAEQFAKRYEAFAEYRNRLHGFEIDSWPVPQQVDWHLMRAEMNGFDFNHRVLKPWVRDPAYYQSIWTYRSDVPGHEGPTHHAVTEYWTYEMPLSPSEEQRLIGDLSVIAPLMKQAQKNLTGNARDLWVTGIRNIRAQRSNLDTIAEDVGDAASDELKQVIAEAQQATDELVVWLEAEADSKTGAFRSRQGKLHLVSAERAPGAADVGRRSAAA